MKFFSGKGHGLPRLVGFTGLLVLSFVFFSHSQPLWGSPPSWFEEGPRPTVAVVSIQTAAADLRVGVDLYAGAPARISIAVETADGRPVASTIHGITSPRDLPQRETVLVVGMAKRFLVDGAEYRVRVRDALSGAELVESMPFVVDLRCEGEVCRFVPELGVATGSALWLDRRLAVALTGPSSKSPIDLLGAAVANDPSLAGPARSLAARLASSAEGLCHCRWLFEIEPQVCEEGTSLEIFGKGAWIREDNLAAQRTRRQEVDLTARCWQSRLVGTEPLRIAFGEETVRTDWPRVEISSCGSCSGTATHHATFYASTFTSAFGPQPIASRAEWSLAVRVDGAPVLSDSDLAAVGSPAGLDSEDRRLDWTGVGTSISWQSDLGVRLEAPSGVVRAHTFAAVSARIRSRGDALCAEPPTVSPERQSPWQQPVFWGSQDPDQISVVIGECRPPR